MQPGHLPTAKGEMVGVKQNEDDDWKVEMHDKHPQFFHQRQIHSI
jgi:hypothetical protein